MKIVDLFSGVGGLTFGFSFRLEKDHFVPADNKILFANEWSEKAANAYRLNFPSVPMKNCDIREVSNESIRTALSGQDVDVLIGGPPCQSFSTIGQRLYDDKAKLYREYLRVLNVIRPKIFLFENVPGLLTMREQIYARDANGNILFSTRVVEKEGKKTLKKSPVILKTGRKIIDIIKRDFSRIGEGYRVKYAVLNAADYGVPQNRERVIVIGIRRDLPIRWRWDGIVKADYTPTLEEAISDLPPIGEGERAEEYQDKPHNAYQEIMRYGSNAISQHFCGVYGEKIRTVIKNVRPGEGRNEFNARVLRGEIPEKYFLTSGFHSSYGRLVADKPSSTITNNMCTPSSNRCIHYAQDRALTPREGARIQSFPDWFVFCGNRTDVTSQIGNAVPPLMAMAIARYIEKKIYACCSTQL